MPLRLLTLSLLLGLVASGRDLRQSYRCPPGVDPNNLNFFVIGDWGQGGSPEQKQVASMMSQLASCYRPSFVLSTGDNFYFTGLQGPDDPDFRKSFSDVYTGPGLNVPWYAVLGNHDYGDGLSSQLTGFSSRVHSCSPALKESLSQANQTFYGARSAPYPLLRCPAGCCFSVTWQANLAAADPRWQGARQGVWSQRFADGLLDVFLFDTNPQISAYSKRQWADPRMEGGLGARDPEADRANLERMLRFSRAPWKVVVGHHPVRSYGKYCGDGECKDMDWMRKVLKDNKVAVYTNGHDHDLQLIKDPEGGDPVTYVVSGAGSNTRPGEFSKVGRPKDAPFLAEKLGIVAVSIPRAAPGGVGGGDMALHYWTVGASSVAHTATVRQPPPDLD